MARQNKLNDISQMRVDSVRKELLLADAPVRFTNHYKYGIAFILEHREQSNGIHMVRKKAAPVQYSLSKLAVRKLSRRNSIHLEHCSPSSITRVVVSKKKMERNRRLVLGEETEKVGVSKAQEDERPFKERVKEALRKIRAFGLLMREFRENTLYVRSKSVNRKRNQNKNITMSAKKDEEWERKISIEKMFVNDIVKPRRESIIKTFDNITTFVKDLMKEKPTQPVEEESEDYKETYLPARKKSSYYSNLSEGSLTDEDENSGSEDFSDDNETAPNDKRYKGFHLRRL